MMTNANDKSFVLSVYFDVYANVGGEMKSFDAGVQIAPAKAPEQPLDIPWSLNGKSIGTPTEPQPLLNQNNVFKASETSEITIAGNVVDSAGNAIDGAKVSLTPENTANAVVPDPVMTVNGTFTFENVDPEILPAMINVEKDGYTFTPVRITENDIVDGKIIVSNLVLKQAVQPANEIAQTSDVTASFALALLLLAMCGCAVVLTRAFKNQK